MADPTKSGREYKAVNGTPGWVVWCSDRAVGPFTDPGERDEALRLAGSFGCPLAHVVRPVLVAVDGRQFRYADKDSFIPSDNGLAWEIELGIRLGLDGPDAVHLALAARNCGHGSTGSSPEELSR